MSRRSVALAILLSASVTACRRSHERLADVPRIAYGSKPAVVRVNAYATAQFRYPTSAISAVAEAIGAETRNLNGKEETVDTGAGGSGSGLMVRSDGCILTSGHVIAPTRDAAKLEQDLRRNGAIAALVRPPQWT